MYYLGCDSGGSKTAFLLTDEQGAVAAASMLKAADYRAVSNGFHMFGRMLSDGVTQVCKSAMIRPKDISFAFLGVTGFGERPDRDRAYLREITQVLPEEGVRCVNDNVVAWAGSLACGSGVNLISGTGANSYGRNARGDSARIGGWGSFCGDEGSAYWLGRQLLSLYTKEADGRLERGRIYDIVRDAFQITSDFDFRYGRCMELSRSRSEVASLQRLLLQAAEEGDPNAVALYCRAAEELAMMVGAMTRKLDFGSDAPVKVSYAGGTFRAGKFLLGPLAEQIKPFHAELVPPKMSPVFGAALAAIAIAGGAAPGEALVARLAAQSPLYFQ